MDIDFYDQDGESEYGITVLDKTYPFWGAVMLDSDDTGEWENVDIAGFIFDVKDGLDYIFMGGQNGQPYNNGEGKFESKNLTVRNIKYSLTQNCSKTLLNIYGNISEGEDENFHENLTIHDIIIEGNGYTLYKGIQALNNKNFTLYNLKITDVNESNVPGTSHDRIATLYGTGQAYNLFAENYYGNILQVAPVKRDTDPDGDFKLWNIIGYNNQNYSCVEINVYNDLLINEYISECPTRGDFITAYNMGLNPSVDTYTSTCLDIFNATDVEVYNSVVINGHNAASVVNPGASGSNNLLFADNTAAKIANAVTFSPAIDSPLRGAGTDFTPVWALLDFNGVSRPTNNADVGAAQFI